MASSNSSGRSNLFDDIEEPDYDHLNVSSNENNSSSSNNDGNDDDDDDCKKSMKKEGMEKSSSQEPPVLLDEDYILGTLIVRVVAARSLDGGNSSSSSRRRIMHSQSPCYNPYASVQFGGQTQRTTVVPDSVNPLWPRSEAMYMDVSLPIQQVTYKTMVPKQEEQHGSTAITAATPIHVQPMLTFALFSATSDESNSSSSKTMKKKKVQPYAPVKKSKQQYGGDSDDPFLGCASIDVTPLLTGKKVTLDKWLTLSGGKGGTDVATVRCVCEYETSDPAPRPGDIVCFTRFCQPADLYPVPITLSYKVQEVSLDGSDIVLEYTTLEGWICTFIAHRFMVLCEERCSATMLDRGLDSMATIQERLAVSPLLREVQSTVTRVPDEGLVFVGLDAIQGAGSLLDRWWNGGVNTALGDLQYATNWDGRFSNDTNSNVEEEEEDDDGYTSSAASTPQTSSAAMMPPLESPMEGNAAAAAIPGMPCCPITGEPMVDPVVASDGHTYERSAIARWLHTNDRSPMTGSVVAHKNLVPNYVLLSSIQELSLASATTAEAAAAEAAAAAALSTATVSKVDDVEKSDEEGAIEEKEDDRKMPAL